MSPSDTTSARSGWLLLLAVLLVTAGVYRHALSGELVYDDRLMIERNPRIAEGRWSELATRPYWDFLRPEDSSQIGYWRPLTALFLAGAYALGGGSTVVLHAASLAVHLAAAAAAFLLARRLLRSPPLAAGVALLFALHPIHVESVAWISALNDPLFGLFALLALERYLAWRDRGSRGVPWASAALLVLALLAKELAAAVLPLVLAIDLARRRVPGERSRFGRPLAAYAPFGIAFGLYLLARIAVFQSLWAGFDRTTTDFAVSGSRLLLLRAELLGGAAELLAWPQKLQLFRPFRPNATLSDPAILRAVALVVLLAAAVGAAAWRRRRRVLFALLLLPAGLLPALIRVESLGRFPLSDRFLYLPALGAALLLALLARRLPRRLGAASIVAVAALYAARSAAQIPVWHDEESLFRHAVATAPRSVYARWGLGRVLLTRYGLTKDPSVLNEAYDTFEAAKDLLIEAKLSPSTDLFVTSRDYLQVNLGSGWCHLYRGEFDDFDVSIAIGIWEELARGVEQVQERESEARALGIRVRSANLELELVYTALGTGYTQAHRFEDAERAFAKALELNPNYPEARQNLGRLYAEQGDWQRAAQQFERALALRPGHLEDRLLLAQACFYGGEVDRAETLARRLAAEDHAPAQVSCLLARLALDRGDGQAALPWADQALRRDPMNGEAWYLRGTAYAMTQRFPEALAALRRSAELQPHSFEAYYQYAALMLQMDPDGEQRDSELPVLRRAYELCEDAARREALARTLARLVGERVEPLLALAQGDRARGRLEEALGWIRRALEIDPDHAEAIFLEGRVLRDRGRPDQALERFQRAARLLPDTFNAQYELGSLLADLGRSREAIEALERARDLGPPPDWEAGAAQKARETVERRLAELRDEVAAEGD